MTEERANRLIESAKTHAVQWICNADKYADHMPKINGLKRGQLDCPCGCSTPTYLYDWKALTEAASQYAGRVSYLDAYDANNARLTQDELENIYMETAHEESISVLNRSYEYCHSLNQCGIRAIKVGG